MGVMNHESVMKNIIPVVMAGILGIYGLITAAILVQGIGRIAASFLFLNHFGSSRHLIIIEHSSNEKFVRSHYGFVFPGASKDAYSGFSGYAHLASGLCCGLSSLGAGLCIGIVGDAGVRANGQQPKLYVPMVLILIFAEALGLYGLIVAIILATTEGPKCTAAP